MTTILILTLVWILCSIIEAFIQGHYYDSIPVETKKHINLHPFFVFTRSCLLGIMFYEVLMISHWVFSGLFIIIQMLIFSFFHNGTYYKTRNWLNSQIYPKGFWDSSETSRAVIELGLGMRITMAAIGFIGLALLCSDVSELY